MTIKVLLIVDPQKGFCPGGELAVSEGDQIMPVINRLILEGNFYKILASKDWHPEDHISFAETHPGKKPFDKIVLPNGQTQTLWATHCVANTESAMFHPTLFSQGIDRVFLKGQNREVDSYSAFLENDKIHETGLRQYLESLAKELGLSNSEVELSICGLATDYCVSWTVIDAINMGFKTEVIVDACRAVNLNPGDDIRTLKHLASLGAKITESKNLLAQRALPRQSIPQHLTLCA